MKDEEINGLIKKYVNGNATEGEVKLMDDWYQSFENNPGWIAQMSIEEKEKAVNESFEALKAKLLL